jgi:uncharacterized protein (UPF0262 family)
MSTAHHRTAQEKSRAAPEAPAQTLYRIADILLDEHSVLRRSPEIEQERAAAIRDLLAQNHFVPAGSTGGPYHLHLAIVENRLVFTIRLSNGEAHGRIALSLNPFRQVVRDYFSVCETYFTAIRGAPRSRIEVLDAGRRGLHNEGAELLTERLKGKAELDFETARRLFTLICVLHLKA